VSGKYGQRTNVTIERSRAELEELLRRYGATELLSGWTPRQAFVGFTMAHRSVKLSAPMPDRAEFASTGKRRRTEKQIDAAHEQAQRQRWRALVLVVRAKLEAVDIGLSSIEDEFMADLVLPGGATFGHVMRERLDRVLAEGTTPKLLPEALR